MPMRIPRKPADLPVAEKGENVLWRSELMRAAAAADLDGARRLLVDPDTDVSETDPLGRTALHHVLMGGRRGQRRSAEERWVRTQIVRFLIGRHAPLDARDVHGCTPLIVAAMVSDVPIEAIRLLLKVPPRATCALASTSAGTDHPSL